VKILAIDTATENCSAALLIDGEMRMREVEMERGHAERILPMVDDLLADAQLSLTALDAIAFGRGPGSFTGVRLAATVTQGLAFGAGLGIVPVSDLRAVAQRTGKQHVLVCNDARMSEVYWCYFKRAVDDLMQPEVEERVSKPGDVKLPTVSAIVTAAGRGFLAYGAALRQAVPTVDRSDEELLRLLPHAREIALLSVPAVTAGELMPPEAAIPVYLRDNVAHVSQPPKTVA
jgi:tRNA threonylcarbamoyladenosine biosynthesis protein TsaB